MYIQQVQNKYHALIVDINMQQHKMNAAAII